jgi:hypothetical protein
MNLIETIKTALRRHRQRTTELRKRERLLTALSAYYRAKEHKQRLEIESEWAVRAVTETRVELETAKELDGFSTAPDYIY